MAGRVGVIGRCRVCWVRRPTGVERKEGFLERGPETVRVRVCCWRSIEMEARFTLIVPSGSLLRGSLDEEGNATLSSEKILQLVHIRHTQNETINCTSKTIPLIVGVRLNGKRLRSCRRGSSPAGAATPTGGPVGDDLAIFPFERR